MENISNPKQRLCTLTLSFYKANVLLNSNDEELIKEIRKDFSFFEKQLSDPHITINAYNSPPPYDALPSMQASYVSPRNICYYHNGLKYIDYSGDGLVIYDKANSICDIYSSDHSLLHESCHMAILSLVNEKLDRSHIHRVHGLGLAIDDKAILILLDMGGGKSTLAMSLLTSDNNIKLISEDSPLIDSKGQILPFPLRIGLDPIDVPPEIPEAYQRYFQRQEFGPKILIDIGYFRGKICSNACRPYIAIVGRRSLGRQPEIKLSTKYQALKEFIKNSVIGLGLYQGIEYVFQKGTKEVVKKIPLGISRFKNALKVINQSRIFEFLLGSNKEENSKILIEFLKTHAFSSK